MLCGNYILSNRSEWTFYFLSSVQFNFTIGEKNILEQIPLTRLGEANEVAETAIFLAQNDYITGQTIVVDGGMTM